MRKILLCLCFVFAVGLLFSACGKDDNKQNPNTPAPTQEETTMPPIPEDKQMSNEEQEAINSSNPETPLPAGLTIFQLCFGSNWIETGSNAEYTVKNNANYTFVFGLKDGDGNIMYKTIDAANVIFDFDSKNSAVSKTNEGFSTSSQFYSDTNANITVTIRFKNLTPQEFHFVLKSNKDKPAAFNLIGTWTCDWSTSQPPRIYGLIFRDNNTYEYRYNNVQRSHGTYSYDDEYITFNETLDGSDGGILDQYIDGNGTRRGNQLRYFYRVGNSGIFAFGILDSPRTPENEARMTFQR